MSLFKKAERKQVKLRMAIAGPSGSGKTWTSLVLAKALGGRTALVDTELGSASHYADSFDFDTLVLDDFSPRSYIAAIAAAEREGYANLVIDSLSHAWAGKGGILEIIDAAAANAGGKFGAWKIGTPLQQQLVAAVVGSKCNVIATLRAKTEYAVDKNEKGRTEIRKVGIGAVQREGLEYEFDVFAIMDLDNRITIEKTRCQDISGKFSIRPGEDFFAPLLKWLSVGCVSVSVEPSPTKKVKTPGEIFRDRVLATDRQLAEGRGEEPGGFVEFVLNEGELSAEPRDLTKWSPESMAVILDLKKAYLESCSSAPGGEN